MANDSCNSEESCAVSIQDVVDSNDTYSCVKTVRKAIHVPLSASFIGNELNGIKNVLDSWKNQYKKSFDGILIGYKNVTFLHPKGRLITDQNHIHQDVAADFFILQPTIGCILRGKINRISETHVGCIINNGINASVPIPRPSPKHFSKYTVIGNELLFQITGLEINRKLIRIHGTITEECMKIMKRQRRKRKSEISESDS